MTPAIELSRAAMDAFKKIMAKNEAITRMVWTFNKIINKDSTIKHLILWHQHNVQKAKNEATSI